MDADPDYARAALLGLLLGAASADRQATNDIQGYRDNLDFESFRHSVQQLSQMFGAISGILSSMNNAAINAARRA